MKKIKIKELDRAIREDLYNMHAMFTDPEAKELLFYLKQVPVVNVDLKSIPNNETYKNMTNEDIDNYMNIQENEETRYVVVADGKLLDGMHRITASIKKGKTSILGVDVSGLIDTDLNMAGHICNVSYSNDIKKRNNHKKINLK